MTCWHSSVLKDADQHLAGQPSSKHNCLYNMTVIYVDVHHGCWAGDMGALPVGAKPGSAAHPPAFD